MLILFLFFKTIASTCSLFNVDCQDTGALITNVTNWNDHNNTVSNDCALYPPRTLQYSTCFDDFSTDTSVNFTALVVESISIDNTSLIVQRLEKVFCETSIEVKDEKVPFLLRGSSIAGKIPMIDQNVTLDIQGGETLGSYVDVSIKNITDDGLFIKELVDCNVTFDELTGKD
ncbi:Oidioi.mRNA.OKI2018_I69.PAR.g8935.t1.cds [Oikopleura dioica]|uniref:Oidioi.mRNA.OKI2018_I69.PAR.g8935.t1.cds n=1 Tax=Oikopleura dioica TaxID=34765 RepID=A0ABN7RMS7_OIKDI|nr:Oidioi.mRNA.OKI2018_I69.PAR.g8935.t1.cds [Oikopleura dioica]